MSETSVNQFISYALQIGALELIPEGRPLKSGRLSPYFFNSGRFNTAAALSSLAQAYAASAARLKTDVVFGPAYKGIPLATAVALAIGGNIGYSFNRKEEKDHGEGGIIVGAPVKNMNVLVVDDVITTGDSAGGAVDLIRAHGGTPIGCGIAFDREERGTHGDRSAVQEFQEKYEIPVIAAAGLRHLIWYLKREVRQKSSNISEPAYKLDKILDYQKRYGG